MPDSHPTASTPLKIGTVDMKKLFDGYHKSKDAERLLTEGRQAAQKEIETKGAPYRSAIDEVRRIEGEVNGSGLSSVVREAKLRQRESKILEIKGLEQEIQTLRQSHEQRLQEQSARLRNEIVEEIRRVIAARVEAEGYDLVFDVSGPSIHNVPVVMYARASYDFTGEILAVLNQGQPAE